MNHYVDRVRVPIHLSLHLAVIVVYRLLDKAIYWSKVALFHNPTN